MVDSLDYVQLKRAVDWLFVVYFSTGGVLFHLPIFLVGNVDKTSLSQSVGPAFGEKLRAAGTLLTDRDARRQALIGTGTPNRIYLRFELFHTVVFAIRMSLNCVALSLIISAIARVPDEENRYTFDVLYAAVSNPRAVAGWYVAVVSFVIHVIAYINHSYHLMHEITSGKNPEMALVKPIVYELAMLCPVGFAIDLSGVHVQTTVLNSAAVRAINTVAAFILIEVVGARPLIDAWGCYRPGSTIFDLKFGMCPSYFDNPEAALQPVCDEPGVRCLTADTRWKTMFRDAEARIRGLLSVSFAIYVLTIDEKLRYYDFQYVLATKNKAGLSKKTV